MSKLSRASTRSAARQLIRELPKLLKLLYRLMLDRRVPGVDKALFALVAAYVLSPIDLIPDFGGLLGMVDDLYLVGLALGRLMAHAGEDVLLEHWDGDARTLGFLIEGVEQLGGLLPTPIRNALGTAAVTGEEPRRRRTRKHRPDTGEVDERGRPVAKVHRARTAKLVRRRRPVIDEDDE